MNGYTGKILHVDLTTGRLTVEEPDERFYRRYGGGSALGAYYALRDIPKGTDPLGPENVLVLSLGPATGLPIHGQSRVCATARSPLTGAIGDSQAGGFWPAEAKAAGFDAFVLRGKAPKPVYLWVQDGKAELRPADHLWGKVTGEVEAILKEELGDAKIEVLQAGPAAEKRVRFACLINMACRANGRTGMGAVMASKNLKAVAVRGHKRPQAADANALKELGRWGSEHLEERVGSLGKYGTADIISSQQAAGGFPTRNFQSGVFEGWENLDGRTLYNTHLKERDTCYACGVRCKRVVEITTGPYVCDPLYGGPEYESISTLGSYCGVSDLAAVCKANELCNAYGLDTISCGATIAFAMECFENGLLTPKDTGGLDLHFGNGEAVVRLVEQIGKREGFGDVLAEGSARAAQKIGKGAERFLLTIKNQEMPAHMPRVKRSLGLIYTVNPFGADHMSSEHDPRYEKSVDPYLLQLGLLDAQPPRSLNAEKVRFAVYGQWFYSALDSLNVCQFVWGPAWQLYGPGHLVRLIQAATGWDYSLFELVKLGQRRLNMLRAFNAREGIDASADIPPERLFEPLKGGPSDGWAMDREELRSAIRTYYQMNNWDPDKGTPTRPVLEELGIAWVADALGL
ncbi:MAG: aldehyde ferredoxin oxidoreductase family protein [Anaerolineae bacterium]